MKISKILNITNSSLLSDDKNDELIKNINTLQESDNNDLSFIYRGDYVEDLKKTKAKAIITKKDFIKFAPKNCIIIQNDNPHLAMAKLSKHFYENKINSSLEIENKIDKTSTIHKSSIIGKNVSIGKNTNIMAGAYIGNNVVIKDNCIIYPNTVIYDFSLINSHSTIHANCTIGSDGFGYTLDENQNPIKIYHLGFVKIGKNVEIGANTCIDRGVFGATIIGDFCKLDNLIQIGHNCTFGTKTAVAGCCGFAGSTHIGSGVIIYGQCTFSGHITITDKVVINATSFVTKSINKSGVYAGSPAVENKIWLRQLARSRMRLKDKKIND